MRLTEHGYWDSRTPFLLSPALPGSWCWSLLQGWGAGNWGRRRSAPGLGRGMDTFRHHHPPDRVRACTLSLVPPDEWYQTLALPFQLAGPSHSSCTCWHTRHQWGSRPVLSLPCLLPSSELSLFPYFLFVSMTLTSGQTSGLHSPPSCLNPQNCLFSFLLLSWVELAVWDLSLKMPVPGGW